MTGKKTLSFVLATLLAVAAAFTVTACGGKDLQSIKITTQPTKTNYVAGETFDPAGMVVSKVYSDKSETPLAEGETYTFTPDGALKTSDNKVEITYTENEKSYKASVNIKVTNPVKSVEVTAEAENKEYIAGQKFDPTGMKIQGTRADGTTTAEVEVTPEVVTYKTEGLVKSDEHFAMTYSGCTFYYDITVIHGAFIEAEAGQVNGARIQGQAPSKDAIAKDYVNYEGNRGDDQPHRGIDEGKNCLACGGTSPCYKGGEAGCTIGGTRVGIRYYVYNHLEWTESTGGTTAKSGMIENNHIYFKRNGEKMLYKLTADKAGKVILTLKMANPNITDGKEGSVAAETKLNEIFKISVGGQQVNIPDTAKLEAVDWSNYKAYNADADFAVKGNSDAYTGATCIPMYYWQNVDVELTVAEGVNSVEIESLWNGKEKIGTEDIGVRLDSISCNADEDEISISLDSKFAPEVKSAQIKVDGEKVLLGVIVDAQSVGFTDDEIEGYFMNTKVANVSGASYKDNVNKPNENDPWTSSTDNGGLGYTTPSPYVNMNGSGLLHSYKENMGGQGNADSVEKITEGANAGMYIVWFDVTIPATSSDNYVGVWTFTEFNYGTAFADSDPEKDILKTDENVTAELGGYCYQVYCDTRDNNVTFGMGHLCLVVQKGSFEGDNACKKLLRRYLSWDSKYENDQELIDLRTPQS